jgi:hypothetical protein
MNQWVFVLSAYGVVVAGTVALLASSWLAMRRAEADAEAVPRR